MCGHRAHRPGSLGCDRSAFEGGGLGTQPDLRGREAVLVKNGERIPTLILDICMVGAEAAGLRSPGGPGWQRGYIECEARRAIYEADVRAYALEALAGSPRAPCVLDRHHRHRHRTHAFDVDMPPDTVRAKRSRARARSYRRGQQSEVRSQRQLRHEAGGHTQTVLLFPADPLPYELPA